MEGALDPLSLSLSKTRIEAALVPCPEEKFLNARGLDVGAFNFDGGSYFTPRHEAEDDGRSARGPR